MSSTTQFLAQLIGPTMIVMAIGLFSDPGRYKRLMQGIKADSMSLYLTGLLTFVAGIAIIRTHSVWTTVPEIVISLFGWMAILKGLWIILSPKSGIATGMQFINNTPAMGLVSMVIGVYISWVGYFLV